MKRKYGKPAGYLLYPILFTASAFFLLRTPFFSVVEFMESKLLQLITEGDPSYNQSYDPDQWQTYTQADADGEVQELVYGMRYGEILCEKAGLEAPLYYGDDAQLLKKGAGQFVGSDRPGGTGTVLIGGHDTSYFSELQKLEAGDTIEVRTIYGTFQYEVTDFKIAEYDDSEAVDLGKKEQLILYTCYPFGRVWEDRAERYFVYCTGKNK